MAQRSNRRFLNLLSVAALEANKLIRKKTGGIHHGQGLQIPRKAEYICADQIAITSFRLQIRGGPYIPIYVHIAARCCSLFARRNLRPGIVYSLRCAQISETCGSSSRPSRPEFRELR